MTLDSFLSQLDGVKPRGSRWSAKCPAHADNSPSLSVSEGERGILLKCWAGCSMPAICDSLGIQQQDLFFDALDTDPQKRKLAARQRDRQRLQREQQSHQQGTLIDALREADSFVQSRRGIDTSSWRNDRLNDELNALSDAYLLLESEDFHGCSR